MPMDRSKYPDNWNEISAAARERAGNKCQHCGLPNGAIIIRSSVDASRFIIYNEWDDEFYLDDKIVPRSYVPDEYEHGKAIKIILTVHHEGVPHADGTPGDPHDKMDNRPENLFALCQRCHLLADLQNHVKARRITRWRKKHARIVAGGQIRLFEFTIGE